MQKCGKTLLMLIFVIVAACGGYGNGEDATEDPNIMTEARDTQNVPTTGAAESYCGDGIIDEELNEECEAENNGGSVSCKSLGYHGGGWTMCDLQICLYDVAVCPPFVCMNGKVIPGNMACDGKFDCSNAEDEEGCKCGDGFLGPGEYCDEGPNNSDGWHLEQTCNATCTWHGPHCNDGQVDMEEECDDGQCKYSFDKCSMVKQHCYAHPETSCQTDEECQTLPDLCNPDLGTCTANPMVLCNTDVPSGKDEDARCSLTCHYIGGPFN